MCNQTIKGISSTIGAILTHTILGHLYTWGNINKYYCSYLRYKGSDLTILDIYFMLPIGLMFQNISPFAGGFLDNAIGTRLVLIITVLFAIGCHILLIYCTNFWLIITGMSIYGFGNGLIYYSVMRCCWRYFPSKKGLLSGLIIAFYGGSSMVFTSIADFVINKEGKKPEKGGYFDDTISKRVPKFLWIMIIILGSIGVLAIICVFPYKEEIQENETPIVKEEHTDSAEQISSKDENNNSSKSDQPILRAICSCQFLTLCSFTGLTFFFPFLVTNSYRTFGSEREIDENFLQILSKVYAALNGAFRVGWGFLFDKFNFFHLYIILFSNQILVSGSYYFSALNQYTFFTTTSLAVISLAGHATIFPPIIGKLFGLNNSVSLLGVSGFFNGLSSLLGPILEKLLIGKTNDYIYVYYIGCGFSILAFILFCFVNKNTFDYNKKDIPIPTVDAPLLKDDIDTSTSNIVYPEEQSPIANIV